MNKKLLQNIINSTKGKFFTLEYSRKDGKVVKRCAKSKNLRILKGGKDTHENADTVRYYDVNKKAYRSFIPSNFLSLRIGGVVFKKSAAPVPADCYAEQI